MPARRRRQSGDPPRRPASSRPAKAMSRFSRTRNTRLRCAGRAPRPSFSARMRRRRRAPCSGRRIPYLAFANALPLFAPSAHPAPGVNERSSVSPDAVLGRDVSVGPFSSIGRRARVGDRTMIYPNVCIGDGAVIGDDCVIHSHVAVRERVIIGNRVVHPEWRRYRRRRLRLRAASGRNASENSPDQHRRHRRRRGDRRRTPPSIGRRLAKRAFRPAPKSTTSCRSDTASTSGRTPCWRRRWASRAAPRLATT